MKQKSIKKNQTAKSEKMRYIENRIIRLKDAPKYLGMGRHSFNILVRDFVTELKVGKLGKAFDRLELDSWLEQYKSVCGRPPTKRLDIWDAKEPLVSTNVETHGTLISRSSDVEFVRALELTYSKKPKSI